MSAEAESSAVNLRYDATEKAPLPVAALVGVDHVSLGTDFPIVSDLAKVNYIIERTLKRYGGNVNSYAAAFGNDVRTRYPTDCGTSAELPNLTRALVERGWNEADIRAVLGENLVRVLGRIWATG